jgi:hypothetical protein
MGVVGAASGPVLVLGTGGPLTADGDGAPEAFTLSASPGPGRRDECLVDRINGDTPRPAAGVSCAPSPLAANGVAGPPALRRRPHRIIVADAK